MCSCFKKSIPSSFLLPLWLASFWPTLARTLAADPTASGLEVHVLVHNYSQVSPEILIKAEERATTIFQQVGVEPVWVNRAQTAEDAPNPLLSQYELDQINFVVRILPRSRAVLKDSALGEALPCMSGEEVCFANVFYNRVEQRTNVEKISLDEVLGHAVAHELGHVLLGSNSHFRTGIMSGQWTSEELKRAAKGDLLFTSAQAQVIRHNVRDKLNQQQALRSPRENPPQM
jgi:hypothetical protein